MEPAGGCAVSRTQTDVLFSEEHAWWDARGELIRNNHHKKQKVTRAVLLSVRVCVCVCPFPPSVATPLASLFSGEGVRGDGGTLPAKEERRTRGSERAWR